MTWVRPTWVLGGGGLLGGAVRRVLEDERQTFGVGLVPWDAEDSAEQLESITDDFLKWAGGSPWSVVWCAGAGIIGTPLDALERETALLSAVLATLATSESDGVFFLASSAGGVYGGSSDIPITESSMVAPLSDYGRNKLAQEGLVKTWATQTGQRSAIARISNLYGPGQSLTKQQGLISQVCLATMTRQPVSLYVSLDTIRDYLYVDDCAHMVIDLLRCAALAETGTSLTKILASGRSTSIGAVLAEARRVVGRAPTVVTPTSARGRLQGSALSFQSRQHIEIDAREHTTLPTGIAKTATSIRAQLVSGSLVE